MLAGGEGWRTRENREKEDDHVAGVGGRLAALVRRLVSAL